MQSKRPQIYSYTHKHTSRIVYWPFCSAFLFRATHRHKRMASESVFVLRVRLYVFRVTRPLRRSSPLLLPAHIEYASHWFFSRIPLVFIFVWSHRRYCRERFVPIFIRVRALSLFDFAFIHPTDPSGPPPVSCLVVSRTGLYTKHFRRRANRTTDFWTLGKERIVEDNVTRKQ